MLSCHYKKDEDYLMTEKQPSQKIKAYIRELYAKLAAHGTANISSVSIHGGEELARALGYNTSVLAIPEKAWKLFAGCGNPLAEVRLGPHWIVLDLGCGVGIDSQLAALSLQPPGRGPPQLGLFDA
jgi:hypothetical protein